VAQQIFTIGYEGSTVEDFIATLLWAKIALLPSEGAVGCWAGG
jgi:hypothetical protein